MQKAVIIKDEASLESLNELLATEGFFVEQASAGPNGSWLVILDEDTDTDEYEIEDLEGIFDEEEA